MEPKLRALPVGFRFCPSDFEISKYFLRRKVLGQPSKARNIPEECHDIFSRHPRDLPGYPREKHFYFYCRKLKNQVTTSNSHNTIWTRIGDETEVFDSKNDGELVGIKRPFALLEKEDETSYDICLSDEEEHPKYNWFMDEISLPSTVADTDWVFCHVFRKKIKPEIVYLSESEDEDEEDEEEEEEEDESVVAESLDLLIEKDGNVLPPSPSPP